MSGNRTERWTASDLARLRDELGARQPDWAELARALGRSERACRAKARRIGLLGESYSQFELARLLSVSTATVSYWRTQGLLVGSMASGGREVSGGRGGAGWRYSRRAVRAFVRAHPELLGERVDRRWLVELLAGSGGRAA